MAELRGYLAEERTFLAWIRTGISLMGFGFVVARFGIFGDLTNLPQQLPAGSAPRALDLVWSRTYRDRRNREPVFGTAFYAPAWRIEPRSVRGPLSPGKA